VLIFFAHFVRVRWVDRPGAPTLDGVAEGQAFVNPMILEILTGYNR
jgi:hypothetical protein